MDLFFEKKVSKQKLPFFLQESLTRNLTPFDLTPFSRIKLSNSQAKQSLLHIEVTLKDFNKKLHQANKKGSTTPQGILKHHSYLKKLHNQIELLSLINIPMKENIVCSLSSILLEKQGRGSNKQMKHNKQKENKHDVFDKKQQKEPDKLIDSYVRMNFSKINIRPNQFYKTASIMSVQSSDNMRAQRKRRLYGSQRASRKTTYVYPSEVTSGCLTPQNSKILWNWEMKQRCKQFHRNAQTNSNIHKCKAIQCSKKLVQNSYLSNQKQVLDSLLKKKKKLTNKTRNIIKMEEASQIAMKMF